MTGEPCSTASVHLLPGSIAAEMSDWASLTLFMASSISLLEASAFRLALRFKPAAKGFSLKKKKKKKSYQLAHPNYKHTNTSSVLLKFKTALFNLLYDLLWVCH